MYLLTKCKICAVSNCQAKPCIGLNRKKVEYASEGVSLQLCRAPRNCVRICSIFSAKDTNTMKGSNKDYTKKGRQSESFPKGFQC